MQNIKIVSLLICMLVIGAISGNAAIVNNKIENKNEQSHQMSLLKDPELPITIIPPFDDDEDQGGAWAWTQADRANGNLDGFASAFQPENPGSSAEGKLIEYHNFNEDHIWGRTYIDLIGKYKGIIQSNTQWSTGTVGFSLYYEIYRGSSKYTSGTIFEKWIKDTPNTNWQEEKNYNHRVYLYGFDSAYQYRVEVILRVSASSHTAGSSSVTVESKLFNIILSGFPDLTTYSPYIWWYTDDGVLNPGDWVVFHTEIINKGEVSTRGDGGNYEVRWEDEDIDRGKSSERYSYNSGWLEPQGCTWDGPVIVEKEWRWHNDMDYHVVRIFIDPDNDVDEDEQEDNNNHFKRIRAPRTKKSVKTDISNDIITKPIANSFYINNIKIAPFPKTMIFGDFNIEVDDNFDYVGFYVNGKFETMDFSKPFIYSVTKNEAGNSRVLPMSIIVKGYNRQKHLVIQDTLDIIMV